MIKESYAIETIKQQCNALCCSGIEATLVRNQNELNPICVHINTGDKYYRFSDPDYNIIISQISTLQQTLKRKNHVLNFVDLMKGK